MEINKIFKEERKEILEFVTNLPEDNCIENFCNYLDSCPENKFEKDYVRKLNYNLRSFGETILRNKYKNLSQEKMLDIIVDAYMECPYSYDAYRNNGEFEEFIDYNTTCQREAYIFIKQYMIDMYNKLIKDLDKTKTEKEIEGLKKMIAERESTLNRYNEDIQKYKEKLEKLIEK